MTTKTGLAYAIYLKYSWDGEGEERGHCIFNLLGVGVASVNTESQRNFFLGSASFLGCPMCAVFYSYKYPSWYSLALCYSCVGVTAITGKTPIGI